MHLGDIEDTGNDCFLTCPWHAFRFSLVDGESPEDQDHGAETFEIKVEDEWVYIQVKESITIEKASMLQKDQQPLEEPQDLQIPNLTRLSVSERSLTDWAILILNTSDAQEKMDLTFQVLDLWKAGSIKTIGQGVPPNQPARPPSLNMVSPAKTSKRGGGGTVESRIAILHALANIEQWAIDLAWDIIARFPHQPHDFYSDFVKVAGDESRHFGYLSKRLQELGSFYGALGVHGSLWESARETSEDLLSRLAIVHMVHEGRGLDVNPLTIRKFEKAGDQVSAAFLKIIHEDEISHVACGQVWFSRLCEERGLDRYATFHSIVRKHYRGYVFFEKLRADS